MGRTRIAGVAVLIFTLVSTGEAAGKRLKEHVAEMNDKAVEALKAQSAEAADLWREAVAASEREDLDDALARYRRVSELVPGFAPTYRRLCGIHAGRGERARAVELCRKAVALDPEPANATSLAMALLARDGEDRAPSADIAEAGTLIDRAAEQAPDDPYVHLANCDLGMQLDNRYRLDGCTARLRELAPDDAPTWLYSGVGYAARGDWDDAITALERAKSLGMPAKAIDPLLERVREAQPWYERWGYALLRVFAGWAVASVVLILAGFLLSAAAMRSIKRLPVEATGRAVGGQALLRRTYRLVLWLACAYYYVSIPLMLLLVVGAGGGLVWGMLSVGRVFVKGLVLVVIIVGATLFAVLKSLFVRGTDEEPGDKLDLRANPKVRGALNEVAHKIGTRPVDNVYMTPGTDLAVTERNKSMWKQLVGARTERCLILGAGVLDGMSQRSFKSILAHEYGHFQNEDTAGGGFALAVRRSLLTMAMNLAKGGVASWYNPVWLFVNGFFKVFLRISQGASRLQEVLCDRWSAFAYGSAAFVEGMRHVIDRETRFEMHANATLNEVVNERRALRNLYAYVPAAPPDGKAVESAVEEVMSRPASPYDSHPPPAERIALVEALSAPTDASSGNEPAWDLFEERAAIEQRMTDLIRERIAESHGVSIARSEVSEPAA